MSDELVRVRDLKKIFSVPAGELHAVDGVDFSIARGSTIGIVGESGCGKSTMGRLLAMLLEATSGKFCLTDRISRKGCPRQRQWHTKSGSR